MLVDIRLGCLARGIGYQEIDDATPFLDHCRNIIFEQFRESDCDWGLWSDADVYADAELVFDLMHRDEEIIARGYPIRGVPDSRNPPLDLAGLVDPTTKLNLWTIWPRYDGTEIVWSEDRRLLEITCTGMGWTLMRRSVADDMAKFAGFCPPDVTGRRSIDAFTRKANDDGVMCFEDASFCNLWVQKMGRRMWCAPDGYITNKDVGGVYGELLAEYGSAVQR